MNKKHPRVILIGRPNVGKSALFNRIADTVRALIYDMPGVTRDPLIDTCTWGDETFSIVDTPGLDVYLSQKDSITQQAIIEAEKLLKEADIILYVVDGSEGLTGVDEQLLRKFQKYNIPIIVAVNKSDIKGSDITKAYVEGVGFKDVVMVSAAHAKGVSDVLDIIVSMISSINFLRLENSDISEEDLRINSSVAFLGRPNVGKSSLLNALLNKDRAIVSSVAGTTREALYDTFEFNNMNITVADTAGVRRSRAIHDRLEELMVSNTMSAIQRASLVVMVLDASENTLVDQDMKLLLHTYQTMKKGILVVWNKIDLIKPDNRTDHIKFLKRDYEYIFDVLPQVMVSAMKKINIDRIMKELSALHKRYFQRFVSELVSNTLRDALHKKPLFKSEQPLKVYKAEVIRSAPPTIVIYTQQKTFFGDAQFGFLDKVLRKKFNLLGVPIKWIAKDN
jgi:GTP-binding protein